jgi:ankyrin repeat protein
MQVRTDVHKILCLRMRQDAEEGELSLDQDGERFFQIFEDSSFEGSRAAARKMKKIAKRQTKHNQRFLLFHSLHYLIRSDSEMLSWPNNSPLLVLLQFVDPNVLHGGGLTPLFDVFNLANAFQYSTHVTQLILAKQLIENGANVNAVSNTHGVTTLHNACYAGVVTNVDFIQLMLKEGADPNAQDHWG